MLSRYSVLFFLSLFTLTFTGFCPVERKEADKNSVIVSSIDNGLDSCFYQGIPLHGKVKFVSSFPDIKVKFVTSFPDDCGEWQIVESFPDFTIQVVESFPDIEIKVVESFPGLP